MEKALLRGHYPEEETEITYGYDVITVIFKSARSLFTDTVNELCEEFNNETGLLFVENGHVNLMLDLHGEVEI